MWAILNRVSGEPFGRGGGQETISGDLRAVCDSGKGFWASRRLPQRRVSLVLRVIVLYSKVDNAQSSAAPLCPADTVSHLAVYSKMSRATKTKYSFAK
jgi:hypothetical protein